MLFDVCFMGILGVLQGTTGPEELEERLRACCSVTVFNM